MALGVAGGRNSVCVVYRHVDTDGHEPGGRDAGNGVKGRKGTREPDSAIRDWVAQAGHYLAGMGLRDAMRFAWADLRGLQRVRHPGLAEFN